MPVRPTAPCTGNAEIARAARDRGLPTGTTLEQLLAHERSTAALSAVHETFDELARWRRGGRADTVLACARHVVARSAQAVRPLLDWFGLV